jgi:hypothetical protein
LSLSPAFLLIFCLQRLTEYSRSLEADNNYLQGQLKTVYRDSSLMLETADRARRLEAENEALKRQLQKLKLKTAVGTTRVAGMDSKATALSDTAAAQREAAMSFFNKFTQPSITAAAAAAATHGAGSVNGTMVAVSEATTIVKLDAQPQRTTPTSQGQSDKENGSPISTFQGAGAARVRATETEG